MNGASHRRAPAVAPAVWAFAAVEVVAFAVWMNVGRSNWFYIDEWDFVAGRKAGDLGDLFRSHNGHWTTLPVLAFRLFYALFGLRTYAPYRALVIILYLASAALLLIVMRRAGVHPWIATSAAALFALFGSGWENIVLPFQITFTGSLGLGLSYLLLADHDGTFDGRDRLGMLAGLLGLMCSGVGIVMVAVVGAAVLVRRGRRIALLHVVPLASSYAIWLMIIGHEESAVGRYDAADVAGFVRTGLQTALGAIGPFGTFGIALVVILAVGLSLASAERRSSERLQELAAPVALVVGSLALLTITAVNRASFGADWARQSRYISLVTAMLLPALAVAVDAVAKRWRQCLPLGIALFLVGIPANLHAASRAQRVLNARDAATRATMLSLPGNELARRVPRSVRPEPTTASAVTIGWLLEAESQHRLPSAPEITHRLRASDDFRLSFDRPTRPSPRGNCRRLARAIVLDVTEGTEIGVYDSAVYFEPSVDKLVGVDLLFPPADDAPIIALRDVAGLRIIPAATHDTPRVCTEPPVRTTS